MIPTGLTPEELERYVYTTGESVSADKLKELLQAEYQRGHANGYGEGYDEGYSRGARSAS